MTVLSDVPLGAGIRRETSLIPADTIASRALVVVIAIMTLLACLTAGAALLIGEASQSWRGQVAQDVTIQIKPKAGEDLDALVKTAVEAAQAAPGVSEAHALSLADTERMLEPWLGRGLDIGKLPIPRLAIVRMQSGMGSDLTALRANLAKAVPEASLDDHSVWLSRLDTMANVIVTFAGAVFVLVIVAMATAVGFATRGAVAANREIIEVLHFVGASDLYVARQFQTHFMRLGIRGAVIGGCVAGAFFLAASLLSIWWRHSPGGEEIAALFGAFALGFEGFVSLALICLGIGMLTGYLSRSIVFRHLRAML